MSRLYNLGSLNVDHVYGVPNIVTAGETVSATSYDTHAGGKGLNQSLAAAKAGVDVLHVGCIGEDGQWLKDLLAAAGVDVSGIRLVDEPTGRAEIQITPQGENAIIISSGANATVSADDVMEMVAASTEDDWLLVQNETSQVDFVLSCADQFKGKVAVNVAPIDAPALKYDFSGIDLLIVNELEAGGLAGVDDPGNALRRLQEQYPDVAILLTLGRDGLRYRGRNKRIDVPAFVVDAVDETAAGDSFIGYLVASLIDSVPIEEALVYASAAGALAVTRHGAGPSIPTREDVWKFVESGAPGLLDSD